MIVSNQYYVGLKFNWLKIKCDAAVDVGQFGILITSSNVKSVWESNTHDKNRTTRPIHNVAHWSLVESMTEFLTESFHLPPNASFLLSENQKFNFLKIDIKSLLIRVLADLHCLTQFYSFFLSLIPRGFFPDGLCCCCCKFQNKMISTEIND